MYTISTFILAIIYSIHFLQAPSDVVGKKISVTPTAKTDDPLTTHVLDINEGKPGIGITVVLSICEDDKCSEINSGTTNSNGRLGNLIQRGNFSECTYRLRFKTKAYYDTKNVTTFYPYLDVVFTVPDKSQHYHVPVLISAHGFSSYRGS